MSALDNKKKRRRVIKDRRFGVCHWCSEPTVRGASRCLKHEEILRVLSKKKYKLRAELGLCTRCQNYAESGYKKCDSCRKRQNAHMRQYYWKAKSEL